MLRHKRIDRICTAVLAVTLLATCGLMGAAAAGLTGGSNEVGYENRLFDASQVHTIDIVMDDWEGFLDTCVNEEYTVCTVVIDGERCGSVGIRAKGNTSLSSVASYGNDRYSFKLEFDHYQTGKSYHGLDKLSLNNLIQDKTRIKDYLAYTLMNKMGVAAPLCSFAQVNVNGEFWGLYLAVEGVEDSFLSRNGLSGGELYKPDSSSFGGGRGNGRDFDMTAFANDAADPSAVAKPGMQGNMQGDRMGGMGSDDVKLKYIDDDPDSYANIFDNAKTDVSDTDKDRLIASLKALSEGDSTVVDADAVIRYLVVHNFLCNGDSYTGQLVHNYYLYESDGVLSMIPWDYNLAFGGFSMGGSDATSTVNSPIDSPVTSGELSDRPMVAWIFENEAYIAQYHALYVEFLETAVANGWLAAEIDRLIALLKPYVEADENAFYTADTFEPAVAELQEFCALRAESIAGQLEGSIPSTTEAQRADSTALVDASGVSLADMGDFGGGKGDNDMGELSGRFGGKLGAGDRMPPDGANFPQVPTGDDANRSETAGNPLDGMMPLQTPAGSETGAMPSPPSGDMPDQAELPSASNPDTGIAPQPPEGSTAQNALQSWLLLAGCAAVLIATLIFAAHYKSNR